MPNPPAIPISLRPRGRRSAQIGDTKAFQLIRSRRVIAFAIDSLLLVGVTILSWALLFVSTLISFGLLTVPMAVVALIAPFAYFTLFLGSRLAATPGMIVLGLRLISHDARPPTLLQALLRTAMFHATVALLTPLVLIVSLFDDRGRAAHDFLSGTVVINDIPGLATSGARS